MKQFIEKYSDSIMGVLSGFDRLVLRGSLRRLCFVDGIRSYLSASSVLLKDFGTHVEQVTKSIKAASESECQDLGITMKYLPSSKISKEAVARQIASEQGITQGPICVLTCVELGPTFDIHRNPDSKKLELVSRYRKCAHYYHYSIHPVFGFMSARIQSWFPFGIQVCINGREWLSRQMDEAGMDYYRQGNCFPFIEDFSKAQSLMDTQLQVNWPTLLNGVAATLNPIHEQIFEKYPADYYWSAHQSEWATDVVFNDPDTLRRLYPMFVRHAINTMSSTDVMRFLGQRVCMNERIPAQFADEVMSSLKARHEGVRIKHQCGKNSVKGYDKAYVDFGITLQGTAFRSAVLRGELTVNDVTDFKVFRPKEGDPGGECEWRVLRRGVADLHRRAQVSQRATERYLDAISSVDDSVTLEEVLDRVTKPTLLNGKRVRALMPFAEDMPLLEAINDGEFCLNGLRNRDLQRLLFDTQSDDPKEARRRSAWVSRKLRLLRAHGILAKVPQTHRYKVSAHGRTLLAAVLNARHTPLKYFLKEAA